MAPWTNAIKATGRRGVGSSWTTASTSPANEILMALGDIEPFMTEAIAELAAAGIADPTVRQIAVRAADFATRPAIEDPGSAQHSWPGRIHDSTAPQS